MNFRLALYYVVQRSDNVLIVPRAPHKDALPLLPLLLLHFFPLLFSFSLPSFLPLSIYKYLPPSNRPFSTRRNKVTQVANP